METDHSKTRYSLGENLEHRRHNFGSLPSKIEVEGEGGARMGLFAARNYAKGESLVVYMGEDIGPADELPTVNTLKGQSQHTLQVKKRWIIGNRLID